MLIDNKFSRFLSGPYIFFGLISLLICIMGLLDGAWFIAISSFIVTAYLFGTSSGIDINTDNKTYRTYNKHFGLFKTGSWKSIDQYIGVTLVPMRKVTSMYSRSNRVNSVSNKEYHIYFVNKNKKPAIPVKICKTKEDAWDKMDELAIWLHLPVFSPKR